MKFCPRCKTELVTKKQEERERLLCPADGCGYIFWDNPIPVVAAIVEHEGGIILANNFAWPENFYGLITGFLEKGETPEQAVLREVEEELNLSGEIGEFVGTYSFYRLNQLILAYHVKATGNVRLNHELRSYQRFNKREVKYWNAATGFALRDWLKSQGIEPELIGSRKIRESGDNNEKSSESNL